MTRQKSVRATIPGNLAVGEILPQVAGRLGLPSDDVTTGGQQSYVGYLERTNSHLGSGDRVSEALREGDEVVLHPETTAG